MATHKSRTLARDLKDALSKRQPSAIFTEDFDTDGSPTIYMTGPNNSGAEAQEAFIKVRPEVVNAGVVDIVGNQRVYAPQKIQIVMEESATPNDGLDLVNEAGYVLDVLGECLRKGCLVELWVVANAAAVDATAFATASNLKATFDDLYHALRAGS